MASQNQLIEAHLKQMLKVHAEGNEAQVGGKQSSDLIHDLQEVARELNQRGNKKKKKKAKHANTANGEEQEIAQSAPKLGHHRQSDPSMGPEQEQLVTDPGKKKKKKKAKKKAGMVAGDNAAEREKEKEGEESDSDADGQSPSGNSIAKYLDGNISNQVLRELEKERVFPLKKKSTKFPQAKYFCRLCEYHCDAVAVCRQHVKDARHRRKKEIMEQDKQLRKLPLPSSRHLDALDVQISQIFLKFGLSDEDLTFRSNVTEIVADYIRQKEPDLSLRMYGSSLTGFGLKSSDVNIDLVIPADTNPAKALTSVYKILKEADEYRNVKSNFSAKVPSVLFSVGEEEEALSCEITVNSDMAYYTSRLLALYARLEPQLRQLAVVFRHWGRLCQIDRQDEGSLPAYCLGLMAVYYLQQHQPPLLPALWKDLSEEQLKRPKTSADILSMLTELEQTVWEPQITDSVGSLWLDMLKFYGINYDLSSNVICVRRHQIMPRGEKKWNNKRIAVEDPFSNKRNVARSLSNPRIFEYLFNCLRKACLYFGLPTNHEDQSILTGSKATKEDAQTGTKTDPRKVEVEKDGDKQIDSPAQELEQERTGTVNAHSETSQVGTDSAVMGKHGDSEAVTGPGKEAEFTASDEFSDASIKEHEFLEKSLLEETNTQIVEPESRLPAVSTDQSSLDDLTASDTNVHLGTENTDKTEEIVTEIVKLSVVDSSSDPGQSQSDELTAAVADSEKDSVKRGVASETVSEDKDTTVSTDSNSQCVSVDGENIVGSSNVCSDVGEGSSKTEAETCDKCTEELETLPVSDSLTGGDGPGTADDSAVVVRSPYSSESESEDSDGSDAAAEDSQEDNKTPGKKLQRPTSPPGAEYNFVFSPSVLTDGKGIGIICSICEKEGHLKQACPEEKLPPMETLPPMTKYHLQQLTMVIKQVPRDFKLTEKEIYDREGIRRDIEKFIQELFQDAQLTLFGSSCNGFGFHFSDLDICVTFRDRIPENINFVEVIEILAKKMKQHRGLYNVFPITTAKVPIIKFKHRQSQLEGDISLYNILAQHNTNLLYTYSCIDQRVVKLGYAIKVFAKVCDIGDASKGSLSSYAYMLMILHYLQHTSPPVIPVLQELYEGDKKPEVMVDGWNTWFYGDLKNLHKVWPDLGKNNQSVGELWSGFFIYYLETFNLNDLVITIKQFEPLSKFEKLWNGSCMALEDPFDLRHNLGAGLSRTMNKYIMTTLIHAREVYGTPITELPNGFCSIQDYFFDHDLLTEGDPPNDRCCRVCNKIGHIAKECPRVAAKKEREALDRQRREEKRKNDANHGAANSKSQSPSNRVRNSPSRSLSDPADRGAREYQRPMSGPYNRQQSYSPVKQVDSMSGGQQKPQPLLSNPRPFHGQPGIPLQPLIPPGQRDRGQAYPQANFRPQGGPNNASPRVFFNSQTRNIPFQTSSPYGSPGRPQPSNHSQNFSANSSHQNQSYRGPMPYSQYQMPRDNRPYHHPQPGPQQSSRHHQQRQVTAQKGAKRSNNIGVTVNNEYYHDLGQ